MKGSVQATVLNKEQYPKIGLSCVGQVLALLCYKPDDPGSISHKSWWPWFDFPYSHHGQLFSDDQLNICSYNVIFISIIKKSRVVKYSYYYSHTEFTIIQTGKTSSITIPSTYKSCNAWQRIEAILVTVDIRIWLHVNWAKLMYWENLLGKCTYSVPITIGSYNRSFLLLKHFKLNSEILIFLYLFILLGYYVATCWDRNIDELHCIIQLINHHNYTMYGLDRNYLISPDT